MEYGSGPIESFDRYDLSRAKMGERPEGRRPLLGLPQWAEKAWKGTLYPSTTAENGYLKYYAQVFDCVEVSSTFYAPVSSERIDHWCSQVGDNFRFLPKWPEYITHQSGLVGCSSEIEAFVETLSSFEGKLGLSLLQLPQHFSRAFHRELYHFLLKIPSNLPLAIEFRHESWFEQHSLYSKLFDYLQKRNIGMVCSDTPRIESVFHLSFPSERACVRYLSDHSRVHDQKRLEFWNGFLGSEGKKESYLILHQQNNESLIELVSIVDPPLSKRIVENLKDPQQTLF